MYTHKEFEVKVQSVSFINHKNNVSNRDITRNSTPLKYNSQPDLFIKNTQTPVIKNTISPLSFMGYSVYILDGGNHAQNMTHFAKAINNKWDVYNKEVKTNYHDNDVKQLESLEWKLKEINFQNPLSLDKYHDAAYIAVPVTVNVPLQNLEAQMNAVMGSHTSLTPQNIRTKKDEVLNFLKVLYENPDKYRQYINYMDPLGQGIEKAYGVIEQINQICEKPKTTVYVPTSHPEYASIKWLSEQRNLEPEIKNFIATGDDVNNTVYNLKSEIEHNGWYDFNLLTLSEAKSVNLKDASGTNDYIYSAFDSSIKDGARGVYNFTPVRDADGNIKGYSYQDDKTVDYPFEEFPANYEIQNIAKFVGRPLKDVLADAETTQAFKDAVWNNWSREPFQDKLFRVEDVYPQYERDANKMSLKGDYIDSSMQVFFRKNKDGEVIYPYADAEGSGRPSVLSMWGSSFSIFNAIKNDINIKERFNERGYYDKETLYAKHPKEIKRLLKESDELIKNKKYADAEHILQYAVDLEKVAGLHGYKPLEALGDLYTMQKEYSKAENCYNTALNELAKKILIKLEAVDKDCTFSDCSRNKHKFENLQEEHLDYLHNKNAYDKQNYFQKMFSNEPKKPEDAEPLRKYVKVYNMVLEASRLFSKLTENCEIRNEDYPAFACNWAAERMKSPDRVAQEIIKRRADNNTYLGDFLHVD